MEAERKERLIDNVLRGLSQGNNLSFKLALVVRQAERMGIKPGELLSMVEAAIDLNSQYRISKTPLVWLSVDNPRCRDLILEWAKRLRVEGTETSIQAADQIEREMQKRTPQ